MKSKYKNLIFLSLVTTLLVPSVIKLTIFADTPGSESDPLVSKSYVDTQIQNALGDVSGGTLNSEFKEEIIEDVLAQIQLLYGDDLAGGGSTPVTASTYTPVYAKYGQILYGMEGTEIILRSGTAKTYITAPEGIVNITTGENLVHDTEVAPNNMLICPRGDGRGVITTSEDAWFLVKGDYTIVN